MHPPIDQSIDTRHAYLSRLYSKACHEDSLKLHSQSTAGCVVGTVERRRLAASQKSPKDQYGWRKPTPYSGSIERTVYSYDGGWYRSESGANGGCTPGKTRIELVDGIRYTDTHIKSANLGIPGEATLTGWGDQAVTDALTRFNDVTVDLSMAFLERKETADFVASKIDEVRRLYRNVKRGKVPRLKAHDIPGKWLEYRYAWTPLVLDAFGAVETLEKLENGTYDRYIITARGSVADSWESDSGWVKTSWISYGNVMGTSERRIKTKSSAQVKVRLDAALSSANYRKLADVGVTNPARTAWELLPYSFVCDWFVGVGDFLDATTALQGLTFKGGTKTVFTEGTATEEVRVKNTNFPGNPYSSPVKVHERTARAFTRSVYLTPPSPSILIQRHPLTLTRVTDALALLYEAFGFKFQGRGR